MRSVVEERDEDGDDGQTDRPEPHILLPIPQTAAGESSAKQHWLLRNVQFSVKSFLSLCKGAVVVIVERNWVLLCSFLPPSHPSESRKA